LLLPESACTRLAPTQPASEPQPVLTGELFVEPALPADQGDDALALARRQDAQGRGVDGSLPQLSPQEHMQRAAVYLANRAFAEARAHWQALIGRYPTDANVPAALFGIGRSYYQERR